MLLHLAYACQSNKQVMLSIKPLCAFDCAQFSLSQCSAIYLTKVQLQVHLAHTSRELTLRQSYKVKESTMPVCFFGQWQNGQVFRDAILA